MKLPHLVTSLELSKRLKELGVKQDSLFYWYEISPSSWRVGTWEEAMNAGIERRLNSTAPQIPDWPSAYTAGELAQWQRNVDSPEPWPANGSWWWYKGEEEIEADTQVNAYAARGIYLITSNLINVTK